MITGLKLTQVKGLYPNLIPSYHVSTTINIPSFHSFSIKTNPSTKVFSKNSTDTPLD